jgi:hypothetical protein
MSAILEETTNSLDVIAEVGMVGISSQTTLRLYTSDKYHEALVTA